MKRLANRTCSRQQTTSSDRCWYSSGGGNVWCGVDCLSLLLRADPVGSVMRSLGLTASLLLISACVRPFPIEEISGFADIACDIGEHSRRRAVHDDSTRYDLPFEPTLPRLLAQGVGGSNSPAAPRFVVPNVASTVGTIGGKSHRGTLRYAFDFAMPVGTVVLAARSGVVTCANGATVAIRHPDGTHGTYRHLSSDSVSVGATVAVSQRIGESGSDGGIPHLHFSVVRGIRGALQSLPIRFNDGSDQGYVPVSGQYYGARKPGPSAAQ